MKKWKYSVVIVTYNRLNLLKECLEHCVQQTIHFDEIVVVNNNSNDGTYEYLSELSKKEPTVHPYHMKKNLGGAGGFHKALELVKKDTDFILIIDDDAIIEYDYIEKIDSKISEDVLAYSGTIYVDGKVSMSHRRVITNKIFLSKKDVSLDKYKDISFDYDLSTFCGLLVSTKIVQKIGLPMSEYFIWYDDTEYSMRIRKETIIRNINAAAINHKTKEIAPKFNISWKSFYGYRNMWNMGLKYSRAPFLFNIYRICFHICKIVIHSIKGLFGVNKTYNMNVARLNAEVLKFAAKRKLGVNPKYTFGVDISK